MILNEYQKQIVNEINGNIAVIATAGSGKTRVLTERICHMVKDCDIAASNILAVTFSKKSCENLVERLHSYGKELSDVSVHTFHALALKIVNEFSDTKYKIWTTMWEKEKAVVDICKKLDICSTEDDVNTAEIFMYITLQKINMRNPSDKLIDCDNLSYSPKDMKKIYSEYEKYKEYNKYIEFEDLINKACGIFKDNPDILKKYQKMYRYIFVDEYQDISYNQNVFLHYLNGNNNLFVVGDSLQAIYSFRGGDCRYLLNFDKEWDNAKVFNLPINYRCSKDIVDSANKLSEYTSDSQNSYYKPALADKKNFHKPIYKEFKSVTDETKYIANIILKKEEQGYTRENCAILTRTNAQLQNIQTVLSDMGIGSDTSNNTLFWDLPEIKLILSYLKLANDTNDNEAFSYCFNKPNRWLDKKFLEEVSNKARNGSLYDAMFKIDRREWRFKGGIDELSCIINTLQNKHFKNVKEMVTHIRTVLNIDKFVLKGVKCNSEEIHERISNIDTFEEICEEFSTIKELVTYVSKNVKKQHDSSINGNNIQLMTIHKSKGLEFPIVFISGCSEGLLPHIRSSNIDDEKRLFYVGITRAEKELYLTHSKYYFKTIYERSSFIDYLEDTVLVYSDKNKNVNKG